MSNYREMSVAEKLRYHRERNREPDVRCPTCGTAMQPADLLPHVRERCEGPPAPHHRSAWGTWSQALAMGVPKQTLSRWALTKTVRVRRVDGAKRYLLRDVAKNLALREARGPIGGTTDEVPSRQTNEAANTEVP